MVAATANTTFDYGITKLTELKVHTRLNEKSGKRVVDNVTLSDEPLQTSNRFWTSLMARYGFADSFFKYFSHDETLERISKVHKDDTIRVCIERKKDEDGRSTNRLLAVSNPAKPVVYHDDLMSMLEDFGNEGLTYSNGIIESSHAPRAGANSFSILGDDFCNRFMMSTPIDGYGLPNVYLALIRQICTNGLVAMSRAFRSQVSLGKGDDNIGFALTRVLDNFNNEEGYAALRQRVQSAGSSWASVRETNSLYKMLVKLHNAKDDESNSGRQIGTDGASLEASPYLRSLAMKSAGTRPMSEDEGLYGSPIIRSFHAMTGDTSRLYGLANIDALSEKRQRSLPVKCKVYDVVNFATEVATHHTSPQASRKIHAWVGDLITNEYDMEGTGKEYGDFADFHVGAKLSNNLTGSR